jgi:hypothetical protein
MSNSTAKVNNPATIDNEMLLIATEIWSELEAASSVEPPLMVKAFYNETVKNEDKSDFKKPLEMTTVEYNSVSSKLNWNATVKYSLFSINSDPLHPIHLCHLLLLTAYKLKVFGEESCLLSCQLGSSTCSNQSSSHQ